MSVKTVSVDLSETGQIDLLNDNRIKANDDLYRSVMNQDADGVRNALANGANINHLYPTGGTVLYWAAYSGFVEMAKLLLEAGADPEIKTINNMTPLIVSVQQNDFYMTKLLAETGANIEVSNGLGSTPLFIASYLGYDAILKLLLERGANKDTSVSGRDPYLVSASEGHSNTFKLLTNNVSATYIFESEGVKDAAIIEMIKNEDDIIFENLVWHFVLGFRKFVIIDNLSVDQTRKKIEDFIQLTKNHAKIFVIEDPIFEYIQGPITTGGYNFIRSVWPEVKWIFPTDADEFWVAKRPLSEVLNSIPEEVEAINVITLKYYPYSDYYTFNNDERFYEKLHYRSYSEDVLYAKTAFKAQDCIVIGQGSHVGVGISNKYCNHSYSLHYEHAISFGLSLYEFPFRSSEQVHRKYSNGLKVNSKAKELDLIHSNIGTHWDIYADYINQYGDKAGEVKFNESFVNLEYAIDDPLPIGRALGIFYDIVGTNFS